MSGETGIVADLDRQIAETCPVLPSSVELDRRCHAVATVLVGRRADALVSFLPPTIAYLTGLHIAPNERPVALVIDGDGRRTLFMPRLITARSEALAAAERIVAYPEYPSREHPMRRLAALIVDIASPRTHLIAESRGYLPIQGYRGPELTEVLPEAEITIDSGCVARLRLVKSREELVLLRHACQWTERAHRALQDAVAEGRRESEVTGAGTGVAMRAFRETLGGNTGLRRWNRVSAGFGGQIGRGSVDHLPECYDPILRSGDILITAVTAIIGGYHAELERVLVIGKPDVATRRHFDLMRAMQLAAMNAIRPGHPCSEIEEVVNCLFERHDVTTLWRHHVGHGLGLEAHEAPFFDIGDDTLLEPGMVLSVEPGLYVSGKAGFRQSDCIVVTDVGAELLTLYPSDLSDLMC